MSSKKKLLSWREAWRLNKRAFALIYKHCPQMINARLASIIWETLTPYAGIYLSALLLTELSERRDPFVLARLVLIILCTAAIISLGSALVKRWSDTESAGIYYKVQNILSEKMLSMDYEDADSAKIHALYNTIDQNRNGGDWGLGNVYRNAEQFLCAALTLLGGTALTVTLFTSRVPETAGSYTILNNSFFVLVIIALMLAITYFSPMLANKAGSYFALNSDSQNLSNRLIGFFGFLGYRDELATDIRIYRQDLICDKYSNDKNANFGPAGMFARLGRGPIGLYSAASAAVSVLFTGVVYAFVCLKALGGAFGLGAASQYLASTIKLSGSVSALIKACGDMRNNASFIQLVFDFLDIPNRMYQGSLTVEKRIDRDYEIEFRNVSFQYPGSSAYALRNVSIKFRVGQRLAVVGMNGSGKTTFIKLLCRLYDPTEGEILLNGIDIRKYNYAQYLSVFSVVFQDFKLFPYELGQNIATAVDYDARRAQQCLADAGFGKRLEELSQGLDTYLYKDFCKQGVDISGGEAQKIALARALYKDAPFIVLDEPTAALDPIAESEVYSSFDRLVGDKTAIYISHRLSSCRFCDDIAVFDGGRIIQQGSHDELVQNKQGKYHELWHAQAQYYTK